MTRKQIGRRHVELSMAGAYGYCRTFAVSTTPLRAAPMERSLDLANILTNLGLTVSVLHDRWSASIPRGCGGDELLCWWASERSKGLTNWTIHHPPIKILPLTLNLLHIIGWSFIPRNHRNKFEAQYNSHQIMCSLFSLLCLCLRVSTFVMPMRTMISRILERPMYNQDFMRGRSHLEAHVCF